MACIVFAMVVSDSESISSFWSGEKPNLPLTIVQGTYGQSMNIIFQGFDTCCEVAVQTSSIFFWDYGNFISPMLDE